MGGAVLRDARHRFVSAMFAAVLAWVIGAVLCACGPVRLVSPYDEIIDRGASDVHTRVVVFIDRMVRLSGTPDGEFSRNVEFYADLHGSIATLRMRASVQEKNEITTKLFEELDGNVERLRQLHEMGRERGLTPAVGRPALQAIETNCRSIIEFEVAKRRGSD